MSTPDEEPVVRTGEVDGDGLYRPGPDDHDDDDHAALVAAWGDGSLRDPDRDGTEDVEPDQEGPS